MSGVARRVPDEAASPELRRQRAAIVAGLCTQLCGRNARPDRRTCTTCGQKDSERSSLRYREAVAVDRRHHNLMAARCQARRRARQAGAS